MIVLEGMYTAQSMLNADRSRNIFLFHRTEEKRRRLFNIAFRSRRQGGLYSRHPINLRVFNPVSCVADGLSVCFVIHPQADISDLGLSRLLFPRLRFL